MTRLASDDQVST